MADPNSSISADPFDQLPDLGTPANSGVQPAPSANFNDPNYLNELPDLGAPPQTSAFGVFARQAGQAVLPTVGGLPAAAAGAELGALAGAPLGPVGAGVLGFAGGAAGYIGGASAISGAQSWALKQLPQSWQDKLGTTDRQANVDAQQHPVASFLGGVAPYALTMSPMAPFKAGAALADNATAFQRVMANPITSRLFGGAAMGGMQLGQEEVDGQKPDWTQVAIATGMGIVFNKPNALGERLTNWGAAPFRTPLAPSAAAAGQSTTETEQQPPNFGEGWQVNPDVDHSQIGVGTQIVHTNTLAGTPESGTVTAVDPYGPEHPGYQFQSSDGFEGFTPKDQVTGTLERVGTPPPTIAQAQDARVVGPGITDAVFQGTHVQNPDAQAAAQASRQTEMSVMEPPQAPDLNDIARRMEPDLFQQYDELKQQADGLRQWLSEYAAPPDDQIAAAQTAADYAAGRLQDAASGRVRPGQYAALKAASDQAQAALDALTTRRNAFAAGQGQDNEEAAQVRAHLAAIDVQMRDVGPQVAAAYQRAADVAGHQGVAAEPEENAPFEASTQTETPQEHSVAEPRSAGGDLSPAQVEVQKANIAADVERQLVSAGRPQDEASAAGQLIAARYVTRAALFKGALGTPKELYRREAPRIVGAGQKTTAEPLMPTPERPAIAAPRSAATPKASIGGDIESLDPATIGVDAARFQFKSGADQNGVTDRLAGVTQWDPRLAGTALVYRDADGKNWIADGHQRLALAQRLAETQPDVRLNAFVLNAADGVSDAEARAIAAAKNIAEGTGTPIDAAKVIREAKASGIELPPMPPRSALVRDGRSLARLSLDAFGMAINNVVPTNYAAIVGRLVDDAAVQTEAMRVLAKAKPENAQQAELMVRDILATGTEARAVQGGLFGDEHFAASAVLERAKIADEALKQLKRDKSVFQTLVKEADRIQGAGANSLDTATNQNRLTTDEQAAQLFNQLVTRRGTVSNALTGIARRLQSGEITKTAAGREFVGIVRREIESGVDQGPNVGGTVAGTASERERELAQPDNQELFQGARGKIRISPNNRPVITLLKDANASTFIHESAHDWLEQLTRDAGHPAAPDSLRADYQTVRTYLGIKGRITTPQHERFARSFEQYMREGTAPSPGLASVFAKFKNWLTVIYQTVKSLGQPINKDIRGVFDRMLSENPQRTFIADERSVTPNLADIHEADEAEAAPHEKEPLADRVTAEYSRYVAEQPPKVANELATAEAVTTRPTNATRAADDAGSEIGASASGPSEVDTNRGAAGPQPASGAGGKDGSQKRGGGSEAVPGSAAAPAGSLPRNAARFEIPTPGPTDLFPKPDGRFTDLAGNIRLENLTDSDEVAQAIREAAERNDDFMGDRRGVITDGQVMDLADALGMDAAKLNRRKLGQAFNAEQIIAARKLLIQSATTVAAAMKKAATGNDIDLLDYMEARDRHQMIQAQVAGITAEAGRALRAFRNIKGQEDAMNVDAFIKSATGRTLFQLKEEAKLGSALDTPEKVSKFLADGTQRTFGKMLLEYWINGLISGPATHTTYIIGNELLALQKAGPETAAAAAIGAVRARLGRTGERVLPGEVGAQFRGMAQGFAPAVKAAADAFRTGATTLLPGEVENPTLPFQPGDFAKPGELDLTANSKDAAAALFGVFRGVKDAFTAGAGLLTAGGVQGAPLLGARYQPTGYIPDIAFKGVGVLPLGTAARLPSRMVAAIHSFFRAMNYSTDINAEAYRKAAVEGASDIASRIGELRQNPDAATMARSVEKSNDLTLMGQGGDFVQGLKKITNIEVLGLPVLKFVDPFVNIAANIMDQSIVQRTPAGLFSQSVRDDLMGKNGNVAADTAAAKMLVGTAMSLTFGGLAAAGYASGSGPSDPSKAAMWRLAGNQPHSVRVGNIWYQVNRLGPMGMLMGIAADLQGIAGQAEKGQMSEAGAALVHAFAQNILDESFMRGPADLIQAVENSDQYGPQYVRNFLSSFVPYSVGMAQMARAMDPYQRQARTITDAIMQKIPGMSENLLPRRDIWGQPMPSGDALISPGVTAIYETKISTDPVNIALEQLGIAPAPVERRIRAVPLNPQQYDDYARIAGVMTKQNLDRIVRSSNWQTWPTGTRYEVINATIDQCREAARGVMLMKYPQIAVQAAQMKIAKSQGQPYTGVQQ